MIPIVTRLLELHEVIREIEKRSTITKLGKTLEYSDKDLNGLKSVLKLKSGGQFHGQTKSTLSKGLGKDDRGGILAKVSTCQRLLASILLLRSKIGVN